MIKGKQLESYTSRAAIQSFRFIVFFIITYLLLATVAYAQPDSTRKILILNSYHKGFKWTDDQVFAAEEVLSKGIKHIELFVEYMDTKRIYSEEYLEQLSHIYRLKYKNVDLDAIITTDDNALYFALKYHKEVFGEAPVSFCGINDYKNSLIEGKNQLTGIVEILDIKPTIDLALNLRPETRKILVVVDSTPTGLGQKREIGEIAGHYNNLKFEYIEGKDTSNSELFEKLRSLSQDSIVLLAVWLRDKNNVYLSPNKIGPLISSNSTVPIFGLIDMYYGYGIVGGKILNSQTHGSEAAKIVLRVINGEKPANIPVIFKSTNPFMFDYKQLERWQISLTDLPKNSIIINKPISFYKKYKRIIWIVIGIFASLVIIILILTANILRRKKAEKALRKSEERFALAIEGTKDGLWDWDLETNDAYYSDRFARMLGYEPGDLPYTSAAWSDHLHPDDLKKASARLQDYLAGKTEVYKSTFRMRTKSGEYRWITGRGFCVRENGKPTRIVGFNTDITERKKAEKELLASENKFSKAFHNSLLIMTISELENGRYLEVNEEFSRKTGYEIKDTIGKTSIELGFISNKDRLRITRELDKNGRVSELELELTKADGSSLICLYSGEIIDVENQNRLLSIALDITERKKMEKRIQDSQKMESIGSLAGGIAHDFNNLLFPIIGLSEMMLNDFPSDSMEHQNLHQIFQAGKRGRELVQQILSFSRQSENQRIPVHIQKILKEVLRLCRATIPSDLTITKDIQADCAQVMTDPTQIHQVAMNLITNAYHAVESTGGTIMVQLKETDYIHEDDPDVHVASGRYAVLSVSDTGTGIDPAAMHKIFDPYFTTKEKGRGTGLGLATVFGIVKAHGGDIKVHSEVGKGSCFHVYLPVLAKSAEVNPEKQQQPLSTGTEHILVVDDEKSIVHLEKQMLERLGYQTSSFTSSREALNTFKTDPSLFDLVITDMNMPNMNGMQLATELIAIRPDIPIILCTGFSKRISSNKAEALGIRGLLMKPVGMKDLSQKVREVLDTTRE